MEHSEQSAGERQVRELLIKPLERRGLLRPAGQSREQFADMVQDICARLAYMSAGGLMALEEQCAANPGGKGKDRFPIGPVVLKWAAAIEPPADSGSPLIRAVFRHQIGQDALDQGYAPELLALVRRDRRWPGAYALKVLRDQAAPVMREFALIEEALLRGDEITHAQASLRARRRMQIDKCREIAELAREGLA